MTHSRNKGKRGELEFAGYLRNHGHEAIRGVQFKGGPDSPDVRCTTLPQVHFEVKRVESGTATLYKWLAQATKDAAPGKFPVVAHRTNGNAWVAILPMEDLLRLLPPTDPDADLGL